MKKWRWYNWLGIAMLVVGIGMIIYNFTPGFNVWLNQREMTITDYTTEQIAANTEEATNASYTHNDVVTATPEQVRESRERIKSGKDQLNVLGAVYMPEQEASVSIIAGLSQSALLSGAGTFYPEQRMGEGNYPLASHNMSIVGPHLLLTDMVNNTKAGDKVYLTDLDKVYEYKTYFAEMVQPTRIDLVNMNRVSPDGNPIVTLMTCNWDGSLRYIVQAELVDTTPYEEAPQDVIEGFEKA